MNDKNKFKELDEKTYQYIKKTVPQPPKSFKRRVKVTSQKEIKLDNRNIIEEKSTVDDLDDFEIILDAVSGKLIGWDYLSMISGGESQNYSQEEIQEIVEKFIEIPVDAKFSSVLGQTIENDKILCGIWNHYYKEKLIENDSLFVRFNPTTKKVISVRKYWYEED